MTAPMHKLQRSAVTMERTPPDPNSDWGDRTVDTDGEDDVEAEAEPRHRYEEGLYCPLFIGETLDKRYQIQHKIGWGGFSTVWLARDTKHDEFVALKVGTSNYKAENERRMLDRVARRAQNTTHLLLYKDSFYIKGRDGIHLVLVLPVRGPSLSTYLSATIRARKPRFRVPGARHLLLALQSLHDAGIVHRGKSDLNDGAVLWNVEPMHHWTLEQLYSRLGRPLKVLLKEDEGGPAELVETKHFPIDMLTHPATLADFGHALDAGTPVENTIQTPSMFCAPERFHGAIPSFASDMWSYTFIFAQFYIGTEVVWGEGRAVIDRLVQTLGTFPEQWKDSYCGFAEPRDWWYDHLGKLPRPELLGGVETLEEKIDRLRPEVSEVEKIHALAVMRKGFCIDPERRITAAQLLEDPDFNALMAYYGA